MAFFRRRSPDRQAQVSSTTPQNPPPEQYADSGTDPQSQETRPQEMQYQDPQDQDTARTQQYPDQQYQDPGRAQQYQDPQYQDPGRAQQYQDPQYQDTARAQQSQDPQYQDTARTQQYPDQRYEDQGRAQQYQDPQYQNAGRTQQYESASAHQHHERTTRTNQQQVRVARSAILAPRGLPGGWVGEILLGLGVVVLGLIVAIHTTFSLTVLAILLGVAMIVSGVYHVVRSMRRAGDHRMWGGIAGVLFFLVGIWLIRHISTTITLIALFAGFAFIIAGISALAEAVSGRGSMGRIWSALLGLICLAAGIAAIVTPIHTLYRLSIVLGWALFAIGLMHIIGAFVSRRELREESRLEREQITIPGQRTTAEAGDMEGTYGEPTAAQAGASSGAPRHRRSRM